MDDQIINADRARALYEAMKSADRSRPDWMATAVASVPGATTDETFLAATGLIVELQRYANGLLEEAPPAGRA